MTTRTDVLDTRTNEIVERLLEQLREDQLLLPTLPEVALQIREAANDPAVTPRGLSELLGSDPAISARLVRIANSPLMRSLQPIDSLPNAISRLGIAYSCNLSIGLAMEQMFQATSEVIDERMRLVWKNSTEVAGIATVLTKHYTRLKPDQATLAALVHQIGILPVLAYAEEHSLFTDPEESEELDDLIKAAHPILGEKILQTWRFPENLQSVPRQHVDLTRQVPQVDYADVIIVAKLLCPSDALVSLPDSEWDSISAFSRLGLRPGRDILVAEGLQEETLAAADAFD